MNREESAFLSEKISKYIGENFYSRSTADYQSAVYKERNPDVQKTFSVGIFNSKPPYGCLVVICSEEEWEVFKDICLVIVSSIEEKESSQETTLEQERETRDNLYMDSGPSVPDSEWEDAEKPGGLSYKEGKYYRG